MKEYLYSNSNVHLLTMPSLIMPIYEFCELGINKKGTVPQYNVITGGEKNISREMLNQDEKNRRIYDLREIFPIS